jgi:pyruvate-formate lyase-activating enzyme
MREIQNAADVMAQAVQALRDRATKSTADFQAEIHKALTNLDRMDAVTADLKAANSSVEQVLTGNTTSLQLPINTPRLVDANGVILNQ